VLEGLHTVKHALRFGAEVTLAVTPDRAALAGLAARLAPDLVPHLDTIVREVAPALFQRLAPTPPRTGVLALARRPSPPAADLLATAGGGPVVLLENPSDLGNIGAVVRVAAAAGAAAVLTTGRHDPWHPAVLRGSAGLHFALPVRCIAALPATARPLLALHPEGAPLAPAAIPPGAILAFGTERGGLGADLLARADARVAIPMQAGVSSLNLATAVAVVLYAWRLARGAD
jgi:TrmH family RNA methyltransferase